MELIIKLSPEEEQKLFSQLQAGLEAKGIKEMKEPLNVSEFAGKTNMNESTIYRMIQAGEIRCVPGLSKKLIPASELEKFQ